MVRILLINITDGQEYARSDGLKGPGPRLFHSLNGELINIIDCLGLYCKNIK